MSIRLVLRPRSKQHRIVHKRALRVITHSCKSRLHSPQSRSVYVLNRPFHAQFDYFLNKQRLAQDGSQYHMGGFDEGRMASAPPQHAHLGTGQYYQYASEMNSFCSPALAHQTGSADRYSSLRDDQIDASIWRAHRYQFVDTQYDAGGCQQQLHWPTQAPRPQSYMIPCRIPPQQQSPVATQLTAQNISSFGALMAKRMSG